MRSRIDLLACIVLAFLLCGPRDAAAQKIYKYTDEQGRTRYTTDAPTNGARPATLPRITIAPYEAKAPAGPKSCARHGGFNCAAGNDADGSVICFDGFRDSMERFNFSCTAAKLSINEIKERDGGNTFTVFVRNLSGVDAARPVVVFRTSTKDRREITGPEKIEAYGVAEFHISLKPFDMKPQAANLEATCANCP